MENSEISGALDDLSAASETGLLGQTRRQLVTHLTVAGTGLAAAPSLLQSMYGAEAAVRSPGPTGGETIPVTLRVNGTEPLLLSANTEQNYVATFQLMHSEGGASLSTAP